MGLEARKNEIRRDIERKARYLESLEAMPDLEELADGTVLGLVVTYGASRPYPVIAYKAGGNWHLTGERSPNKISSDDLAEWLMSGGRHLRLAQVLAEFEVGTIPAIDLTALLLGGLGADR
jgi:hypothetical protein